MDPVRPRLGVRPDRRTLLDSPATMGNIRSNLWLASGYDTAGIPIAAGVLDPAFAWLLSPVIAAAAMALSSVSVIVNALRLRTTHLRAPPEPSADGGHTVPARPARTSESSRGAYTPTRTATTPPALPHCR